MLITLQGDITIENYSQTQLKVTATDGLDTTSYYFDKKLIYVYLNEATSSDGIGFFYIESLLYNGNTYSFPLYNIVSPVVTDTNDFLNLVNGWTYNSIQVSLNSGTPLTPLALLNLIEGSNIVITATEDIVNNKIDITISSTGGGGGLPPDGTYGDIVVSSSGTVWTVTDDTSNQQVAVYEDTFLRGTRPALNFYDDGGPVSVAVTDDPINNRVDIEITSSITGFVTGVSATGPITSSGGTTPTISTSMSTSRLIGRTTAGTGVMEEISIGSGLSLSGGTLDANPSHSITHATAAGTDTYTTSITGVTSYADGDVYLIRFTNGNTTNCTLNINSLGAVNLYRNNDGALIGGDIVDGAEMLLVYNSTLSVFQCIGTAPNTLLAYVTNAEAITITKGQPVYVYGGQGDRITVKLAYNTSDLTSAQTIGVVQSTSIAANQKGLVIVQGELDGLSLFPTSTWADGDYIYLGATAGSITNVKPSAPNHLVYLGYVTTASNGAAGRWYVKVQNGYELKELHDVQAQSPSLNDTLYYDSVASQWKTAQLSTILGYTPVTNARTISTTAPLTGGGDLSADRTLAITQATTIANGYLSSTDWNTFNGKPISPWGYRRAAKWYTPLPTAGQIGSFANVSNSIRYYPVMIERDITITQLGINVVTISGAGLKCRVGIYSNDASTTSPLTKQVDSGEFALDATGAKTVTGLSVVLTKGLYWFCYVSNAAAGTIASVAATNLPDVRGTTSLNLGPANTLSQSYVYAALPTTAGSVLELQSASAPCVYYYY